MLNIFLANAKCNHRNSKTPYFLLSLLKPIWEESFYWRGTETLILIIILRNFLLQYYFINLPLLLIQAMCWISKARIFWKSDAKTILHYSVILFRRQASTPCTASGPWRRSSGHKRIRNPLNPWWTRKPPFSGHWEEQWCRRHCGR